MKSSTKIIIAETLTDILYVTLWCSALRALGINFSLTKTYFIVYLIAIAYVGFCSILNYLNDKYFPDFFDDDDIEEFEDEEDDNTI